MYKAIIYGFFALLFCVIFLPAPTEPPPERMELAFAEMSKFAREIEKNSDLEGFGLGGRFWDNEIHYFSISFLKKDYLNLDEGRIELIEIVEKFCKKINQNKKLLSYLQDGRCTPNEIFFDISCFEPTDFSETSLRSITFLMGEVHYIYACEEGWRSGKRAKDTYEEAVAKNEIYKNQRI